MSAPLFLLLAVVVLAVLVLSRRRARRPDGETAEFEGWWKPTEAAPDPKLRGKIEWEPSPEGGTEIDLLVRHAGLDDGAELEVVCDGRTVLTAPVERGKARR